VSAWNSWSAAFEQRSPRSPHAQPPVRIAERVVDDDQFGARAREILARLK